MILLEINEFNPQLFQKIADRRSLKAIKQIQGWNASETYTDDKYESGYLEPWVQWVSIHTGKPSSVHNIKNLGDVPALEAEQIWERWSHQGQRSVVWGVMNGDRRSAKNCEVFIPDPWTFSESAFPEDFAGLIRLPRYLAKNYLDVSKSRCIRQAFSLFSTLIRQTRADDFADGFSHFIEGFSKFGPKHVVFIVFFEYLSAMAFLRTIEKRNPDKAILFINMLAHVQHHYWRNPDGENCPELNYAADAANEIVSKILARAPDTVCGDRVAVTNGLSQKCTYDEPPWVLHRQKNPTQFLSDIGLAPIRVEPLMTHDAHISFETAQEADTAFGILTSASVNGKSLFHVECNKTDPLKLFYRLDFYDPVNDSTEFVIGNRSARFKDHFVSIVQRTGKHIPNSVVYSNWRGLPSRFYNFELFNYL